MSIDHGDYGKDVEKDALDELYAKTKDDIPTAELDAKIIALATEQAAEKRSNTFYSWQRVASVAAVMVFTVYIFFDVREAHQLDSIEGVPFQQTIEVRKKLLEDSAPLMRESREEPSVEMDSPADGVQSFSVMPEPSAKREPSTAREASAMPKPFAKSEQKSQQSISFSEKGSSLTQDDLALEEESFDAVQPQAEAELYDYEQAISPQAFLDRIQVHVDAGEVEIAKQQLKEFTRLYPRHEIPEALQTLLKPSE